MSQTAKTLFLAQSSVSQIISDLEAYYDVQLFERLNKHLYLTPCGLELLSYTERLLNLYDEMESHIKKCANSNHLKIGATSNISANSISQLLNDFREQEGIMESEVFVYGIRKIEANLLGNELDVALCEIKIQNNELVCEPVITDHQVLICGQGHPFYIRKHITIEELNDQPFILREQGNGTRCALDSLIKKYSIRIKPTWVCNNNESMKIATSDNQGIALISRSLIQKECELGTLHEIPIEGHIFETQIYLVYHRDKYFNHTLQSFIEFCRNSTERIKDETIYS